MGEYSKYISEKRRAVPTPKDLVDENGKVVFGTFDKEFETMELLRAKKPTKAPDFLRKFKLTLWEATEVHLKNGVLLAVVCDMGIFGKQLNMFYDKRSHKVYCWDTQIKSKDTVIAPNLLNGSVAEAASDFGFVKYVNNFQDGKAELSGKHTGKCLITPSDENKVASPPSLRFNPAGFAPPPDTNLVFTRHEKLRFFIGFCLTAIRQERSCCVEQGEKQSRPAYLRRPLGLTIPLPRSQNSPWWVS